MARRRRPKEQPFGFDAFVDLVTNLVGIVLRLILVVMMGAHLQGVYQPKVCEEAASEPQLAMPEVDSSALSAEIEAERKELDQLQARLAETLRSLDALDGSVRALNGARQRRLDQGSQVSAISTDFQLRADTAMITKLEGDRRSIQERIAELQKAMAEIEKKPPERRTLRYHLPISKPVDAGELIFECRGGRVTFIDLNAFLDQVKQTLSSSAEVLKEQWEVNATTREVGAFQMKYTIVRERGTGLDRAYGNLPPVQKHGFSYGLDAWEIVPVLSVRGETQAEALGPDASFRKLAESLDPDQVVLTFFVYPDSFELFRQLRDHLYQRGFVVVGRPLPMEKPILGSRRGSISQGQ